VVTSATRTSGLSQPLEIAIVNVAIGKILPGGGQGGFPEMFGEHGAVLLEDLDDLRIDRLVAAAAAD
jgi:hypothetical protein